MSPVPPDEPVLRLAVAFVNTYDLLEQPPDHLSPDIAGRIARRYGEPELARALSGADLTELRALRDALYAIFAGATDDAKVAALNAVLVRVDARARFLPEGR